MQLHSSINFRSLRAISNVYTYEKEGKQLVELYEPSLYSVAELIKLGNVDTKKDEYELIEIMLADPTVEIADICYELIRASAHLSVIGKNGAESIIHQIEDGLQDGINKLNETKPQGEVEIKVTEVKQEKEEL